MSLRTRLILSHALIVVLCLAIVGVAVLGLLQQYRIRFAVARLDDMTIPIYVQARSLVQGDSTLDEVWDNLQEQSEETGVHILLVDDEGAVVKQVSPGEAVVQLDRLPAGALPSDLTEPYHGTYRFPKGQAFVFVAYPLAALVGSERPTMPETLILAVPLRGALLLWAGFAEPFIWAALIALAVSIVLAIVLARSIYGPVQRVTEAAERIAQGHYEQEVPLAGPREVRRLALRFNQMARRVQQSQQRLRDFVADASHELRSPLTAIRGFALAMVDGTARDSEAQTRSAQIIQDESMRLIRLVDDLLELSRIESGQIQMSREPVDVGGLLRHCHELFSMRAEEKGVTLKMEFASLPSVVGDIDRLEQVFSNLLDNALKHTLAGGTVTVSAHQAPSGHVRVRVADTGPGIAADELPHVFERFYQADPSARKAGTGLGLAIAREIARAHGGDIEARSPAGGGAEFTVRLPVGPAE